MDYTLHRPAANRETPMRIGLVVLFLSACGTDNATPQMHQPSSGDDGGAPDLSESAPDMTSVLPKRDPKDHPQLPAVDDLGGGVLTNLELWTIVWKGDEALGAQVHA